MDLKAFGFLRLLVGVRGEPCAPEPVNLETPKPQTPKTASSAQIYTVPSPTTRNAALRKPSDRRLGF